MAGVIRKREYHSLKLPILRIDSKSLVEIVERCCPDGSEVAITVDDGDAGAHTEINGIDKIKSNLALVSGGVKVALGGIFLYIGSYGAEIRFHDPSDEIVAKNLEREILEYKSLLAVLAGYCSKLGSYWILSFLLLGLHWLGYIVLSSEVIGVLLFGGVFFIGAGLVLFRVSVSRQLYYRARESFWDRNGDKLVVGMIGIVVGALVTYAIDAIRLVQ